MNALDSSNIQAMIHQPGPLKIENFYLQGERAKDGGMVWSVQEGISHTKKRIFQSFFDIFSSSRIIQGAEFFDLATIIANEREAPLFKGLEKDIDFARFCRKLEGVETEEHKNQRRVRLKKKIINALEKAKIIGKGLAKHPHAKILEEFAWLEALSPDHCYGFELEKEWIDWQNDESDLSFNAWRERKNLIGVSSNQVKYLDEVERNQYEVKIEEGKLKRNGVLFDTHSETSIFSGRGIAIYVVSLDGKLYISSHNRGRFHHSSFLSGAPVKGAGEVQTNAEGQIIFLSPNSGHYNPGKKELLIILKWLQEQSVDLRPIRLCLPEHGENFYYHNAEQFLLAKGNLSPDGIDQVTFERVEGKISIIHQHDLQGGARNNRELLKYLREKQQLNLPEITFKEDTIWGDSFSYNAQEYLEGVNILPRSWEGGEYIEKEEGESEICIHKSRPLNEEDAIVKDIQVLSSFVLKGIDLSKAFFSSGLGMNPVNAKTYFEEKYPRYMNWREQQLDKEISV